MRQKNPDLYPKIEEAVRRYKCEHGGLSPSVREIGEAVGISPASVTRYLKKLKEEGRMQYGGHRSFSFPSDEGTLVRVPVLGRVSCGIPKLAEENIEEYVSLPASLFGNGEFFLLRANGDSMIGAGIDDGDLVLIEKTPTADPNQIVSALVGEEATLKRLKMKDGKPVLHPENENYDDLELGDGSVQGVARMIIKKVV